MKTANEYLKYWNLEKAFMEIQDKEIILKNYHDGEVLFHAGQNVDYVYLLVEGRCRLYGISKEGKEVLVNYKEAPEIFGEMEVLINVDFKLSLSAAGEAVILKVSRKIVERKLLHQVEFLHWISTGMAKKMWLDSSKQIQVLLNDSKKRVAFLICQKSLSERKMCFMFSGKDTAMDAGISERQLRRVLGEWEKAGIIERKGRKLQILDFDALEQINTEADRK